MHLSEDEVRHNPSNVVQMKTNTYAKLYIGHKNTKKCMPSTVALKY